ncbi:MAG: PDDEXK nuclease domain-containing protein [bacterium]
MNSKRPAIKNPSSIYERIRSILESARSSAARSVNTAQVAANWLIGREIVEEEQKGSRRAGYGEGLVRDLSARLQSDYGAGYSLANVKYFRKFYLEYPRLVEVAKGHAVRSLLPGNQDPVLSGKSYALRSFSSGECVWKPGQLHPNLSWTHYRTLLRVDKTEARAFYEIESINNNWSARELERQIGSLLYDRLALSKDKKGLMRLAVKGHEVAKPSDIFKDPMIMEFLGLPESPKLVETGLEQSLIDNLQTFLLELGKGFAFVARQERLTLDGDHFYIDLVFYHTILKCYVIIDLKTGKLTHQDLGQLQLYVNYYDRERRTKGDNPTLGLILCADKNDMVVKYTLGRDQQKTIFASRYKLHLPTEAELKAEIRRELKALPQKSKTSGV